MKNVYRSPCFKFTNLFGNSCRQQYPKTPVSSKALYLLALRSILPAMKSLQSYIHDFNTKATHNFNKLFIDIMDLLVSFYHTSCSRFPQQTDQGAVDYKKKRSSKSGGLKLQPADFFLGRPNNASMANTALLHSPISIIRNKNKMYYLI